MSRDQWPFTRLSNAIQSQTTWNSNLEGKMLTLVDAVIADKEQRAAIKSLMKQSIRDYYHDQNYQVESMINQFTDAFEGEKIEYTDFVPGLGTPGADIRKAYDGTVPPSTNLFKKN